MSHSAHELEFVMTNVEIAAAVVTRKITGKTANDFIIWESDVAASEVGPDISFLIAGMEDFD